MRIRDLYSGKILLIVVTILGAMGPWAGASWAESKPANHVAEGASPGKTPAPTSPQHA